MEVRVITLQNIPQSVKVADRCIKSAKRYEVEVSKFNAITPSTHQKVVDENNINTDHFREIYSRYENALSAFCSHLVCGKNVQSLKLPMLF